jgi:hypothetical protein
MGARWNEGKQGMSVVDLSVDLVNRKRAMPRGAACGFAFDGHWFCCFCFLASAERLQVVGTDAFARASFGGRRRSMMPVNLNDFARALAIYARGKMSNMHRGALLIRCTADNSTIAAAFGNDDFRCDARVRREVSRVRQALAEAHLEELGFGLSLDGNSWALLVRANSQRYETEVAQRFQIEMLKVFLDDVVWRSWWDVCGVAPDSPERLQPEKTVP